MGNIQATDQLKLAIEALEAEHSDKGMLLKEQFNLTYESLKPLSLLKSAVKELTTSPYMADNAIGSVTGIATGYLSRRLIIGNSGNIFRKLFGAIIQYSVTNLVARHPDQIKAIGHFLIRKMFHNKEDNSE
jgi:hypothetical protein